jgi:membrane-associated phospholipid phosphatase
VRRQDRRRRAARVLTEVGAPVVVLVVMPLLVALHAAGDTGRGTGSGLLAALFFGVIPFAYVLRGVQKGRWRDHHVGGRAQRRPVFVFSLASMGAGAVLLAVIGAPRELGAFLLTVLGQAVLAGLITLVWKVSLHAWVSSIAGTALVVLYGWPALVLWPALAAVGWSRLELKDHTPLQVATGTLLGVVMTAVLFPVLR